MNKPGQAMRNDKTSSQELAAYSAPAGERIWLGYGFLPQTSYFGSLLWKKISKLQMSHLIEANRKLSELRLLRHVITFKKPSVNIRQAEVVSFSYASLNISASQKYEQTVFMWEIWYRTTEGDTTTYHLIDWATVKQNLVSYFSTARKLLHALTRMAQD